MKVAIVGTVASSIIGFRADLIKALVAEGHVVYAIAMDYSDEIKIKARALGAIPVDYRLSRSGMNPFSDIASMLQLARLFQDFKPDLVFSYFSKPVIYGTLAAVLAKVPRRVAMLEGLGYIFTEQPNGIGIKSKFLRKVQVFLYRLAFPFLDQLIFLNPDDPVDLLQGHKLKVRQVNILGGVGLNLVDYPYSSPVLCPVRFIFIGRLLAEKGVNEFVEAAKLVKQRYAHAEFIMLGGVDESNPGALPLERLNQLVAKGVIQHPGHVVNVQEWLASSSVFVLPSYREGVPRSTQEAMAIGRAVITTDVPGCRETVVDGVNGFLVPPWLPEVLAEKMITFIEQQELIERMGRESHRIAQEKFDAVKVSNKLMKMLVG